MSWLYPTYAWFGLVLPVVVAAAAYAVWKRNQSWDAFGDAAWVQQLARTVRPRRRIVKAVLLGLATTCLVISLMGPRFGTKVREVERRGVDLVVALDVSASMQAEDVAPNRLDRARQEIKRLLDDLSGDRVGLVLFSGDGFIQCPLTTDYNAVRLFLDVANPDLMATPGTNFGAAVDAAVSAFDTARPAADSTAPPDEARTRALLVVSDGENHVGDVSDVKQTALNNDVVLFTAGVGETDGATIPVFENGQRVGVKRDRNGTVVQSRLDEDVLTRLAENGAYFRIASTSSSLTDFQDAIDQLEQSTFGAEKFAEYAEMYQWPLALALLLLLLEFAIPVRTRPDTSPRPVT